MQLLQLASLCLHGTHLNYMTDSLSFCMLCWSVVSAVTVLTGSGSQVHNSVEVAMSQRVSVYINSGRARCLPPTLRSLTLRKIASSRTPFRCRVCTSLVVPQPCSGAEYVVQYSWHCIHSEPCDTSPSIL